MEKERAFVLRSISLRRAEVCPGFRGRVTQIGNIVLLEMESSALLFEVFRIHLSKDDRRSIIASIRSYRGFHMAACAIGVNSMRNLSDEACHELGEIAPVMEPFVIHWAAAFRVGGSFNAKDWTPLFYF